MDSSYTTFCQNIRNAEDMLALYKSMNECTGGALELDDLLRSCIVFSVSALDWYIHEVVKVGLIQIIKRERAITPSSKSFSISFDCLIDIMNNEDSIPYIQNQIIQNNGWKSFQRATKVSDALRLIFDKNIWEEVAVLVNMDNGDIKIKLDLIVERRDKIVHECDLNPTYPNLKWDINEEMVKESVDFIKLIVKKIHLILNDSER